MLLKNKYYLGLVIMLLCLMLLAGCGGAGEPVAQPGAQEEQTAPKPGSDAAPPPPAPSTYEITWGTAPAGGAWQVLGTAMIEDVINDNPNIIGSTAPVGGFANLIGVTEGDLQVAFSLSATTGDAWDGIGPFAERGELRNFRILATLFPEPTHIVVNANSPYNSVNDLIGKKITPGPRGSAVEQDTIRMLDAYGLTLDDFRSQPVTFAEAAQLFLDGHIDSIFYGAMLMPAPNVVNVSSQKDIRMLSLEDEIIEKVIQDNKGVIPYVIPPGTYRGVDEPIKAFATICNIVAPENMPDDVAYSIVKTIAENFERYQSITPAMLLCEKEGMAVETDVPIHPGALKYYQEQGWVK